MTWLVLQNVRQSDNNAIPTPIYIYTWPQLTLPFTFTFTFTYWCVATLRTYVLEWCNESSSYNIRVMPNFGIIVTISLHHCYNYNQPKVWCAEWCSADNKRYVLRTYTISGLLVFYVIAFISLDLHRHEAHKIRKKHTYMTPRDGKMRQQYVRLRYLRNS